MVLTLLPMFHVGGLNIQTLPALSTGATVVLLSKFETELFYQAFEHYPLTLTLVVPTIMHALMADPRWESMQKNYLKLIAIGSSVVPESLVTEVCQWGVPMIQVYGATETCPIAAYTPIADTARKPASTGKTALHCRIKLIDKNGQTVAKGEILVLGKNNMSGYWSNSQATDEVFNDDWLHTGDVGHFDEEDFLYVDGRIKEIIISGSENLYPAAIENVLSRNPEIMEVAVAGKADDYWGEICVAVIVAMPNSMVNLETIKDYCYEKIAHSSIPKKVILVDELPRNSMGKIVKKSLAELIEQST
ncbi:MAG: long-chain fatty acid--CoA ligase [Gammaproteobacteria bacterium]|nr:long-chain fatty acid--CoA ligase [Gammaproteobacteria bacterium]